MTTSPTLEELEIYVWTCMTNKLTKELNFESMMKLVQENNLQPILREVDLSIPGHDYKIMKLAYNLNAWEGSLL